MKLEALDLIRESLSGAGSASKFMGHVGYEQDGPEHLEDLPVSWNADLDRMSVAPDPRPSPVSVAVVLARTFTDLRRAASLHGALPAACRAVVVVEYAPGDTQPPIPRTFSPAPTWRRLEDMRVRRMRSGGWSLEASSPAPFSVGELVAGVCRALVGSRAGPAIMPAGGLAGPGAAHWRPGDPGVALLDDVGAHGLAKGVPAEMVLRTIGMDPPSWSDPRIPVVDRHAVDVLTWQEFARGRVAAVRSVLPTLSCPDMVPPIDERSVNPRGFTVTPSFGIGTLTQVGSGWVVRLYDHEITRFHSSGCVTDVDVARLRALRGVRVEWGRHTGPVAAVRVIAGLAAAGIPLVMSRVPPWATRLLGSAIVDLIVGVDEDELADDLQREEYSIRLRRCALRTHGTHVRWRSLATRHGVRVAQEPRVSVLLCTHRPEMLSFAVEQVARQRLVDLELVLVLHGLPRDIHEVRVATRTLSVPLVVVEAPADLPLGSALNLGAAHASGRYIAKMDDDDWYSPEHLADLVLAHGYSGADLVGPDFELIYLEQIDLTLRLGTLTERPHEIVAGGALMLERGVFGEIGGYRPVTRGEDTNLLRLLRASGGRIYRTHGLGYVHRRRASGHTWAEPIGYFLRRSVCQWPGFCPSAVVEAEPSIAPAGMTVVPSYGKVQL